MLLKCSEKIKEIQSQSSRTLSTASTQQMYAIKHLESGHSSFGQNTIKLYILYLGSAILVTRLHNNLITNNDRTKQKWIPVASVSLAGGSKNRNPRNPPKFTKSSAC